MKKEKNELEILRTKTLSRGCINDETYEVDDSFRAGTITPDGIHTTAELVQLLEKDEKIKFEGIFIAGGQDKGRMVRLDRKQFLEHWKKNNRKKDFKKVTESFDRGYEYGVGANLVGDDYVPILGGPFNKQMYLQDTLRMQALGFYAYHHDPVGRGLIHITRDFTLGRGYRVDSKNDQALAYWRAFEKANNFQQTMRYVAVELAAYGEVMFWWLPDNQKFIGWQDLPGQEPPRGEIPRVRLIDPSTVWEIITYPEDITRVLAYQQVFPTQYQMYTAKDAGQQVPSSKFVIQQIPAEQVDHFKINCVSNEKRGRSDLFPAFGFMKRLRDTVQYLVIQTQKAAAWAIDTTIDGSTADLQAYVDDQQSQKTIAPAGSEFVHTSKIKRQYMANDAQPGSTGGNPAITACLDMICTSQQIPVSYLGTSHAGGQTRASALVGTEPVTKKFEARQLVYEDMVQTAWDRVMKANNIQAECEITFPELISQDRSQKLKDLALAEELGTITHERMSNMMSKEFQITNYDYDAEMEAIALERAKQTPEDSYLIAPLTMKPTAPASPTADTSTMPKSSALTSDEKAKIAANKGA